MVAQWSTCTQCLRLRLMAIPTASFGGGTSMVLSRALDTSHPLALYDDNPCDECTQIDHHVVHQDQMVTSSQGCTWHPSTKGVGMQQRWRALSNTATAELNPSSSSRPWARSGPSSHPDEGVGRWRVDGMNSVQWSSQQSCVTGWCEVGRWLVGRLSRCGPRSLEPCRGGCSLHLVAAKATTARW